MQKRTTLFSCALMLAAVVFLARFGESPNLARPGQLPGARVALVTVAPTSTRPVAAASAVSAPVTPLVTLSPAPLASLSGGPAAERTATPAAAPDALSRSGASRPAQPTEAAERLISRGVVAAPPATGTLAPATPSSPAAAAPVASDDATGPQPPDRIVAPTIKLESRIVPVGWRTVSNADGSTSEEWVVASYAVSWHKTSARPGQQGNVVLTGHNNIEGEVFRHLGAFNLGDPITLYAGGRVLKYKVVDKFIVKEQGVPYEQRLANAQWIGPFADERLTLVSCWPYTGSSHRIFIIAKPDKSGG